SCSRSPISARSRGSRDYSPAMVWVRHWLLAGVLATALGPGLRGSAHANGRPPATNGVYLHPGDPDAVFVRSTFGLLVSRDGGCSFRWICERAIGYGGEFDPK